MNSPLASIKNLRSAVEYLIRHVPKDKEFSEEYSKYLALIRVTHPEFIEALAKAFEKPGETLGLSGDEMIELMKRLNKPPTVRRAVFKQLSPRDQEANPELDEVAGTSFTSTANVAAYPIPIGMVRREPDKKKKK